MISAASGATNTTVMLDCGFSIRETERRLARLDLSATDISAILVTHEHQDHVGGVFRFARRHRIPVWLSYGTYQAVRHDTGDVVLHMCRGGEKFTIGDLEFHPYVVPHDAREPVQYVTGNGQVRFGVLTDAGRATSSMIEALDGCDALMLECNHDRQMLADSAYPPMLKQRIGGPYGHLSNAAAAAILSTLDRSRLKVVIGAHLSRRNNTPELARAALCGALDEDCAQVTIACQDEGFAWIRLDR